MPVTILSVVAVLIKITSARLAGKLPVPRVPQLLVATTVMPCALACWKRSRYASCSAVVRSVLQLAVAMVRTGEVLLSIRLAAAASGSESRLVPVSDETVVGRGFGRSSRPETERTRPASASGRLSAVTGA